ncbi:MAG: ABC transporter substrate-binding protein [Bacteroidales bacterium]|nr:ABC transporter substrate-binding protein [Bacteroidales bacterium]
MNRSFAVRLLFFLLLSLTISCLSPSQQGEKASFFDYTDCYGNRVKLDSVPARIISLSPAITEMVFMLDDGNKLVGISDFCHYPEATDTMHRVGGMQNINVESLVALNPDVVLIGSIVTKQDMEKMERAGLKVVVIREETKLEGLCDALAVIGNLLDKKELADEQIQKIHNQLDSVKSHIDTTLAPKKVYYVVGFGEQGDFTAPQNSHIHEIITAAGGENIGKDLTSWSVSREYLFEADPDIILIRKEDLEIYGKTKPYTSLRAVKEGHLYPIESGWIDIVSPRNILAIQYINNLLK